MPDAGEVREPVRIAFSLIGGAHQFWHAVPVAAALSRLTGLSVVCYVISADEAAAVANMLRTLGAGEVDVVTMVLPAFVVWLLTFWRGKKDAPLKVLRLFRWARILRKADVVVTVERTSTLLKLIPGRCPPLAHIPHGVGGARRAGGGGMDKRFALFDRVLLAGESDRRSTLDHNLLPPERIAVVGQVKLDGLRRAGRLKRCHLFANARPTVLYNPHFDARRGSWQRWGPDIVERIRDSGRFNLIVAPHVRLFAGTSTEKLAQLRALSNATDFIFDPGSERSIDMTYTLAADIYLGEFSSQLYEFLAIPRATVFFDIRGDGGAEDSKLPEMWLTGETVTGVEAIVPALDRAMEQHADFRSRQLALVAEACGDPNFSAAERAATELLSMVGRD